VYERGRGGPLSRFLRRVRYRCSLTRPLAAWHSYDELPELWKDAGLPISAVAW
jgi:hypothetical protein